MWWFGAPLLLRVHAASCVHFCCSRHVKPYSLQELALQGCAVPRSKQKSQNKSFPSLCILRLPTFFLSNQRDRHAGAAVTPPPPPPTLAPTPPPAPPSAPPHNRYSQSCRWGQRLPCDPPQLASKLRLCQSCGATLPFRAPNPSPLSLLYTAWARKGGHDPFRAADWHWVLIVVRQYEALTPPKADWEAGVNRTDVKQDNCPRRGKYWLNLGSAPVDLPDYLFLAVPRSSSSRIALVAHADEATQQSKRAVVYVAYVGQV